MLKRIKELLSRRSNEPVSEAPEPDRSAAAAELPPVHHGPRVVHRPIPEADLDRDAVKIIRRLTRFEHSAYLVGGCVRDLLLDRHPKDFDIGTSATPRQIKRLFRNCRIIGRRFRLAHIYFQNGKIIEVATFRAKEGDELSDGRGDLLIREDNLFGTMEQDALRRDFTINSLFYDVNDETVLDHADGLGDLRRRLIRTIGDPAVRFREDPIRILRAVRFAARLGFSIERGTLEALERTRGDIPRAAAPRILEELNRLGRAGAAASSFRLLRETGVFETVLPELAAAYRNGAWSRLEPLLDALDRRAGEGHQPSIGLLLTLLLLPPLEPQLGWQTDGVARPPKGLDVRSLIDELLRPLAVRLRVARKDQEYCRQMVTLLARLVPLRSLRRNSRRAILRRECLPDAVWLLEALAESTGGDFVEAAGHWKRAAADTAAQAVAAGPEAKRGGASTPARRSRGGRGRRGRGRAPRGAAAKPTGAAAKPTGADEARPARPEPKRPPVWDDDYFFAALPTVPQAEEGEPTGNRYGSADVPLGTGDEAEPAAEPQAPRRSKRRRRPRRRRRTQQQGGDDSSDEKAS